MKTIIFIGIPIESFLDEDKQIEGYEYFFDLGTLFAYGIRLETYQRGVSFIDMDEFLSVSRTIGKRAFTELNSKGLLNGKYKFPQVFIVNE